MEVSDDGRIVAFYDDPLPGDDTHDHRNAFIFPAFEDAHTHPGSRCRMLQELDARSAANLEQASSMIREWIAANPGRSVYVVHGWNTATWGNLSISTLDAVASAPLFVNDLAYHAGAMNTAMLAWVNEQGLSVVQTDGVAFEAEFDKVAIATYPSLTELMTLIPKYIAYLHSLGVGAVHDVYLSTLDQLDAYQSLEHDGRLTMPVLGLCEPDLLARDEIRERLAKPGARFQIRGVKLFMDGAIGAHTAALSQNYSDTPSASEVILMREKFMSAVARTAELGLDTVGVHAIGDRAVSEAITWMIEAKTAFPTIATWRIEHAEMITDADIGRIFTSGIWLVMQPNFHWDLANYTDRLDEAAMRLVNPFRKLLDAAANIAFGSDGMPEGPLIGLDYAFTKARFNSQKITREEGLNLYTKRPAELAGVNDRGTLAVGREATFVVLDKNILDESVSARETRVLETWVAGKRAWSTR